MTEPKSDKDDWEEVSDAINESMAETWAALVREVADDTNPGDWRGLKAWLPTTNADVPLFGVVRAMPPVRFLEPPEELRAVRYLQEGLRALALPDLSYAPEALLKAVDAVRWPEDGPEDFEAYYQAAWALRRLLERT